MDHWTHGQHSDLCTNPPDHLNDAKPAPSCQPQRMQEAFLRCFSTNTKYPLNFSQMGELEWLSYTFQAFTKINVCSFSIQSRCNSFLNPTAEFIYVIYICNIKTLKIYLLVFKSSYKLMVLVYSQLIEPDGNCRKTDNKFAPQNFSPVSLNWLNGNREGKNKDLLFFTVTQRKCRLNTGSICRFQIFWRPLLLFPCIEI